MKVVNIAQTIQTLPKLRLKSPILLVTLAKRLKATLTQHGTKPFVNGRKSSQMFQKKQQNRQELTFLINAKTKF
jgi:hypothetical protein